MNSFQKSALPFVLSAVSLLAGQPGNLEELTRESPFIVLGHVNSADGFVGADGEVYTNVSVTPESVLKDAAGVAQGEVRFTVKGGTVGDRVVYFSDAPQFAADEDIVLFGGDNRAFEKFAVDAVHGQELIERIEQLREDAGEAVADGEKLRARQFLRSRLERGAARDRAGAIELNAVACAAYIGPKWSAAAASYTIGANVPAAWAPLLQAAAQSWTSAGSKFVFNKEAAGPHVIALGDLGATSTLASTRVEFSQTTRLMARFSMTFNNRFTWSTTGETGKFDVQAIAAHELGHALGLDHPAGTACAEETMWASAGSGETKKRSLEAGDKGGVATLYGTAVSGTPTTPVAPPPPPAPPVLAAPVVTNFALVTTRAVAGKPTVLLFQGTGIDPAKVEAKFTGGPCGTAGCVGLALASSTTDTVFSLPIPAGTYSVVIRNGPAGAASAARTLTINAN